MLQPHERSFRSLSAHGFHRVVYRDWGHPESPRVVVCAHGLTRNGRDFDALAAAPPFGALTDAQWAELARTTSRQTADGRWHLKYDPGIAVPFRGAAATGGDLWAVWDAVRCPTLLLRGALSDLLSRETAAAMCAHGPAPRMIEFPGVGHAPMLLT